MSPDLEPPRETTYIRFGSVNAMSRMVDMPINNLGDLCVGCVGCVLVHCVKMRMIQWLTMQPGQLVIHFY